jgi:cytochrome c-type biogenesis protein CcmH/NrfF
VTGRRHLAAVAVLAVLAVGAAAAVWRSAHTGADRTDRIAAGLRCPACEGESVAESRSPVAAAMRAAVADQVARGRSDAQIRAWFVSRYGRDVLAGPEHGGVGALLWVLPALVLAAAALLAVRASRSRRRAPPPPAVGGPPARARLAWDVLAVSLVAMVALVAVAARTAQHATASRTAATPSPDPVQARLDLAADLERRGEYAAAADVYRQVVARWPDDGVRLRLAFDLLRAGQPGAAARAARQVLGARPDQADALLVLGLAQRAGGSRHAADTLRRFLRVAPRHPAAAQVRRLLHVR